MSLSVVDGATLRELREVLPLVVERIDATIGREAALEILREGMSAPWPAEYVHAERGSSYRVHHEGEQKFVYSDVPRYPAALGGEGGGKSVAGIVKTLERLRRGMDGIMVCVGGETLVDGVPIAERGEVGLVNTLFGSALASPSLVEGRADLFRVATELGDWVVVTANHRFLTPTGWRPLRSLRVGDSIAADGSEHGRTWREISPGSLGSCWPGFHPCDGFATHGERYSPGKQPQLDARGERTLCLSVGHQARVCIGHSFSPLALDVDGGALRFVRGAGVDGSVRCGASSGVLQSAYRSDSLLGWPLDPTLYFVGSGVGMPNDHAAWPRDSLSLPSTPPVGQHPSLSCPGRTKPGFHCGHTCMGYPCQYYSTTWARITSIAFQRYGDFYGLTVPSAGHYSAQGLFHHNSPNLPHFKRSLWPEFRRWCPWRRVHERHQHRADPGWEPYQPFSLVFYSPYGPVTLYCGGIDDPMAWEGPNVSFAFFDEARRKDDPRALKVLDGRVRIMGPNGEPPQLFLATTPRKNWLHDYYGPLKARCEDCREDIEIDIQRGEEMVCPLCQSRNLSCTDTQEASKRDSFITILLTKDNEGNLEDGFATKRAQTLTAAEARVLLYAEWEDTEDGQPFLPSMLWWDECKEHIPDLTRREPMVLAADAATGRVAGQADYFALVGVTRHPERHADSVAIRYLKAWQPRPGTKLDFQGTEHNPGPELEIRRLCQLHNVAEFTYDPTQLHDMATRLRRERVVTVKEFSQMSKRSEADTDLYRLIQQRRITHDGNPLLREHIRNADRKVDPIGRRMRMVKRTDAQKIDLAIALSMASYRCLYLQLV